MAKSRNDKRRRRVILEELTQASSVAEVKSAVRKNVVAKTYSEAAKHRSQLKTTDLIPQRPVVVGLILVCIICVAVILNALAIGLGGWQLLSATSQETFRFSGVGTLSNWFSSMLLLTTGMASLQIYAMRRHRCDDYNGHYQIWLLLAVLFGLASVYCVVDLRSVIVDLAVAAGMIGGNGLFVFLVAKTIALTALVVRGYLEIRASRAACISVVIVWVAYASAIVAQIPGVEQNMVGDAKVVVGNFAMLGHIAVFAMTLFYARFVYLQANDMLSLPAAAAKKPPKASRPEPAQASDSPADVAKQKIQAKLGSAAKLKSDDASSSEDSDEQTSGTEPILKIQTGDTGKLNNKKRKKAQKPIRRAA